MGTKRDNGLLALAAMIFFFGTFTMWRGRASMYTFHQISGGQALAVGALSVIFSITLFVLYLRRSK